MKITSQRYSTFNHVFAEIFAIVSYKELFQNMMKLSLRSGRDQF